MSEPPESALFSADVFVQVDRAHLEKRTLQALCAAIFDARGNTMAAMKQVTFGRTAYSPLEAPEAGLAAWEPGCELELLRPEK
jgi:hypothetical protein